MTKLALGLAAVGALVAATAVPALAQVDVYVGPGGFSVGTPGYYYGGPAPRVLCLRTRLSLSPRMAQTLLPPSR
jgi:hypothetical protein